MTSLSELEELQSLVNRVAGEGLRFNSTDELHTALSVVMIVLGVPTFLLLRSGITAPYGRYSRGGWGPQLNARIAWVTQEAPSFLLVAWYAWSAGAWSYCMHWRSARTLLTAVFLVHYFYRSFVFPFLLRGGKPTPASVWLMSFVFCIHNGFLQGWFLSRRLAQDSPITQQVVAGFALWLFGFVNNISADATLRSLRKPGETGYKIPYGGMFAFISAANYGSEIIEWTGYAIACHLRLAPMAFAFFTFCNLAPRGEQHHQWYLKKFEHYPRHRKAVIPLIW